MACFTLQGIAIKGLGAAVPKQETSNWEYEMISETECRMLVKTTGVERRRVAPTGMATSDLCHAAATALVEMLGWQRSEIESLVFLSQSRDYYLPATSIILQDRLGLPKSCLAFDIGLGCSGFVYGLSIIGSLMKSAGLKKGLLLLGDISSATCAPEDKSTYPLFGDAGTAMAIELAEKAPPVHFNLKSDGSGYEAIMIKDGGIRNRISEASFIKEKVEEGITRSRLNLALNGIDVFNFSITEVPPCVNELFEFTGTGPEDYDYFVMHQANLLMNETIRKKLKFGAEKVPYSLAEFGNTSSASIPLTIVTKLKDEIGNRPLNLLLSGFGVGLSWGAAAVKTTGVACTPLIEL